MARKQTQFNESKPIYIVYARKSKFTGKGESIQNQIDRCVEKIHRLTKDSPISDDQIRIFKDEGFSGGNMERPEFQKMMDLCHSKSENIKAVVCYKLDRFSRSISDFSAAFDELNKMRIEFISVSDDFDTTTAAGKAVIMLVTVFAEFERNILAERIRDNKEGLAKTGRWLGGMTPMGYKSTRITYQHDSFDRERTMCYLETIPREKEIVQRIFHDYLKYHSLTKIETSLRVSEIKTRKNRYFSVTAIRSILSNPVYMSADEDAWNYFEQHDCPLYPDKAMYTGQHGIMAYNKTEQDSHKCTKLKNLSDWIVAIGKHEPFVSGKDWVSVQTLLQQNASKTYRSSKSSRGLLSGLIVCGNCGAYMRPKMYRQLTTDGLKKFSYLCETKDKSRQHQCQMNNPPGEIDTFVCNAVKNLAENKEYLEQKLLSQLNKHNEINTSSMKSNLALLNEQLKSVDSQINNLIQNLASMTGPAVDLVNKQINELSEKSRHLKQEIDYQQTVLSQSLSPQTELNVIAEKLTRFSETFDTLSFEEKRSTLKMLIQKIVWTGSKVHIYFVGDDSDEVLFSGKKEPQQQDCQ